LRESAERLREAQAMGRIGSWEFDIGNRTIRWSDQTYELYERDPALGPPTPEEEATYYSPEQAKVLREYARRAIEEGEEFEYDLQAKLPGGRTTHFAATMRPIKDENGRVSKLFGTVQDITERKRAEEKLAYMASHDPLTGLLNRMLFNDRLTLELAHAHRNRRKLALMLLDLDHFKDVNDTLGHSVGDQLLRLVGKRLTSVLRKSDSVARMGGDEFMLILPEIGRVKDAAKTAKKILEAVREPFVLDDHQLHITTSIGIALYPDGGEDGDTLVKNAEIAMYRAKDQGRDNYQRYTST